jgi:hypothetical protein
LTTADLTVENGSLTTPSSSDGGITWTATLTPTPGVTDPSNLVTLDNTGVVDAAGNAGTGTTPSNNYAIDTAAPTVAGSITVPAGGSYRAGQTLSFTVTFTENVTVTGTDSALGLTLGATVRAAAFVSKTANSVTYAYTVQAGDSDADGIAVGALVLNTTTIADAAGNAADLTLAGHLPSTAGVLVDTTAPTISSVTGPAAGTYLAGQSLDFRVTLDEAVAVTGSPRIALTIGAATVYAGYLSGSGSSVLVFRYTVLAGQNDTDGIALASTIDLNGGTIGDAAGNAAALGFTPPNTTGVRVDATAPTISSVTPPPAGTYGAGQHLDFLVSFSESVTVSTAGGSPRIGVTLDTGGTVFASYQGGSGSSMLRFRLTVSSGQRDDNGINLGSLIDLNGGTITDAVGQGATLALQDVGSTSLVRVDAIEPKVISINRHQPLPPALTASTAIFRVTFNEAVAGVAPDGFELSATGGVVGQVNSVSSVSASVYDVTVSGLTGGGSVRLDLRTGAAGLTDLAGNAIALGFTEGQSYTTLDLTIQGPSEVNEGAPYRLTLGDTGTTTGTALRYLVNWGDGESGERIGAGELSHAFADGPSTWTIRVAIAEPDRTNTLAQALVVKVLDVPPALGISGPPTATEGVAYPLNLSSIDPGRDRVWDWTIDWGDGTIATLSGSPLEATHVYRDGPSEHRITARATDEDGTYEVPGTLVVSVSNRAPTVTLKGADQIGEGSTYELILVKTEDLGVDTPTEWIVHWGDGQQDTVRLLGLLRHVYPDGPLDVTIAVDVVDEDGLHVGVATRSVRVNDRTPTLSVVGNPEVPEGEVYRLNLSANDPGRDTIQTWRVDWGDETVDILEEVAASATHVYRDGPRTYPILVQATDEDGTHAATGKIAVQVTDVAPTLVLSGPATVYEGSPYRLDLDATDPAPDTIIEWIIDWGDGSVEKVPGNPTTVTHVYGDGPSQVQITAQVTDEDGIHAGGTPKGVLVENVAPRIEITGNHVVKAGSAYRLTLGPGLDPGADTISRYVVHWGDGTTDSFPAPGQVRHVYRESPQGYAITVDVEDEDGIYQQAHALEPVSGLRISLADGHVAIEWEGDGQLQEADDVAGPYFALPVEGRSYRPTPGVGPKFYRLLQGFMVHVVP